MNYVNHFRTVLRNRRPDAIAVPGDELVDTTFQPRKLPAVLQKAHAAIFGQLPDSVALNYRLAQLLPCLYCEELREWTEEASPRITYDPYTPDPLLEKLPAVEITGTVSPKLRLLGLPSANDHWGWCFYLWQLFIQPGGVVRTEQLRPTAQKAEDTFTIDGTISSDVRLLGTTFFVNFPAIAESSWTISIMLPLRKNIAQVASHLRMLLSTEEQASLFHDNKTEATWEELWHTHPVLPVSLGAFLLAFTRRILEAPEL